MSTKQDYHKVGMCVDCASTKTVMANGLCGACYAYNKRTGLHRSPRREEIQGLAARPCSRSRARWRHEALLAASYRYAVPQDAIGPIME